MSPVVCVSLFTESPRQIIDFLELLGLRMIRQQQDFAVLAGRSGRVAVHPRATQHRAHVHPTARVLGVPDVSAAVEQLVEVGLEATWWDEAFGRQASDSGPAGFVTLDEEADDTYGFDIVTPETVHESGINVVAARCTPPILRGPRCSSALSASLSHPTLQPTGDLYRPKKAQESLA